MTTQIDPFTGIQIAVTFPPGTNPCSGTPISQLPLGAGLSGSEPVAIVQNGATVQTTTQQIGSLGTPAYPLGIALGGTGKGPPTINAIQAGGPSAQIDLPLGDTGEFLIGVTGAAPAWLGVGNATQVLVSNGPGNNPSWLDPTYLQGPPGPTGATGATGPAGPTGPVPEAPIDGQLYGRENGMWVVAGTGGFVPEAPTDGTMYARISASWQHITHANITDWTATLAPYALTANVPIGSSTTPLMDGTAAIGTGTTWARADHVHPTDTSRAAASALASYLPLAGGTLTGPLVLAADPTANLQPATKQYVDSGIGVVTASIASLPAGWGGYLNKLRNATFDIWQRGNINVSTVVPVYTADGWLVGCTGAAAVQQLNNGIGFRTGYRGQVMLIATFASSMTAPTVTQRIEAAICAALGNSPITFQIWVFNRSAASVTPILTLGSAGGGVDNWSSTSTIATANAQACPQNAWTLCAYTFAAPSAAQILAGLSISVDFPGTFGTSQAILIAEPDLRATPGVATGLNNSPPPAELRPIAAEMPFCQRYYETSYDGLPPGSAAVGGEHLAFASGFAGTSHAGAGSTIQFKATKRIQPTMTAYSPNSGATGKAFDAAAAADVNANFDPVPGLNSCFWTASTTANATQANFRVQWTASAEL